ncbi:putative ATP-binding protein [Proteiniphilum saccharofermentans]|uniref:Putative ATP-binding protein n=1 Tax=Proteiniphilum saccharofermentans TaxID=1642647 RepID=A0A1R3SXF7_9BACT|nr:AAA family ATPase [Proteiniphilum saccharofermentans]SCD20201.1 putative ATP-binding protein [Proteiniphilum saccharofermentans]
MKIKELKIRNFRRIDNLHILPDRQINVIIGENGAGKSSLLDAIAYLLSWFTARIVNLKGNGNTIKSDDISVTERDAEISVCLDPGNNTPEIAWNLYGSRNKLEKAGKTDLSELMNYVKSLLSLKDSNSISSVPIVAYYRVNRSVTEIPLRVKKMEYGNIFEVYKTAFENKTGFRAFFSWYRNREDLENQRMRFENAGEDPQLSAVRRALSSFFPDYNDLHVRRNPMSMVLKKGDTLFNLNQLSDGEQCYLALISDLSRKLVIANPESQDPLKGHGIVLLDEIELHLHPSWQKGVIDKLKEVFPNIQFFITTHSPLVVSNINAEQLILMREGERVYTSSLSFGKEVNDILIDFFNLSSPRGIEMERSIEEAKKALRSNNREEYNRLMDKIKNQLPPSDKDVIAMTLEAYHLWK